MKVALATCAELPHLDDDDQPLVAALSARGVEVSHPIWDAGDAPFLDAELTVIRSTWDYTTKALAFVAWAERVERGSQGRLCNPAGVVRWNAHKGYLLELERKGVAIVPTRLLPAGTSCDVARLASDAGWREGIVVKPAVSAGSRDSIVVAADEVARAQHHVDRLLPTRDLLVQPFVPGIAAGELSLIYLEHEGALRFAHAVNKVPAQGEFRSQPEFRARVERVEPLPAWRAAADHILATVHERLLYARVDLVTGHGGAPWLMELELIEPSLYLAWAPESAALLADAVVARLR
ncbi:MAG: hypothetical protein HYS27_05220 [Deltaproteobacteria bacterium]|nr:hypothetical protein [Deltaproteobacteria bacterium]